MFIQAFNLHSWHGADKLRKCKYFINSYKLTSLFLHINKYLNKVNIFYALGMNAIAYVRDVVLCLCVRHVTGMCSAVWGCAVLWVCGSEACVCAHHRDWKETNATRTATRYTQSWETPPEYESSDLTSWPEATQAQLL